LFYKNPALRTIKKEAVSKGQPLFLLQFICISHCL
jgi:hypothetical protein